jgi:hypothetical protein
MTFVSCGSTRLWSGRSPGVLKRMMERAAFGPDLASLQALVWVIWGTISPKSLRLFLRTLLHARNIPARIMLGDEVCVEWQPRDPRPSEQRSAGRQ